VITVLSKRDNELLTRVGKGTPLGELFRCYWIPALLSEEIAEPDGPPVRVRLLGEDLVAFRDSTGQVGLIGELCAHRRISLYFGRNEAGGLRCVYHGWKYDVAGCVLETPAEPAGSRLKEKIRHSAYPCREAAGIVFTYMGPPELEPAFPNQEWLSVPVDRVQTTKFELDCNYLQALEGDCDTSHAAYLHRGNDGGGIEQPLEDGAPRFEIERTWCGLRAAAIREAGRDQQHVMVSTFCMPFIGNVGRGPIVDGKLDGYLVVYQVPADDVATHRYNVRFKRSQPAAPGELDHRDRAQILADYTLVANPRNNWKLDRGKQRTRNYTGIDGFAAQDAAVTVSMGAICDRTQETLGASDAYVIALRRFLLDAVKAFQRGATPPGLAFDAAANDYAAAQCAAVRFSAGTAWREAVAAQ
jgi:phthalate 4,5-dioxygenase